MWSSTPLPGVHQQPPAEVGLHWFGIVQCIGTDRRDDWAEFYRELFAFDELPDEERFGILPMGRILRSPSRSFYLQLIEPEPGIVEVEGEETLQRMGPGCPDVPAAVSALRKRGGLVEWLGEEVLRRSVPLPGSMRLRSVA